MMEVREIWEDSKGWRPVVRTPEGVVWIGAPCLSRFVAMAELDTMANAVEAVRDAVQAEVECGPTLH